MLKSVYIYTEVIAKLKPGYHFLGPLCSIIYVCSVQSGCMRVLLL